MAVTDTDLDRAPLGPPAALPASLEDWIARDCHGLNFYAIDNNLQDLLKLYMADDVCAHMDPRFAELGEIAGNRLDTLARICDRHEPVLHVRSPRGLDEDWIEFHPAYREMEQIGFGDFGIHCMSRRPGVHGWPDKVPPIVKYTFQYLFTQSEFALMCPISATDTSAMLIERYGDQATRDKLLPGMWSQDMNTILKGAQFMTEKTGGSDVGNIELEARHEDGQWRLYGEKWFCSCADGDVALLLARPQGAAPGTAGLGLFALPRHLDDGSRNAYRIVRLKPKLGSKSMASGEIKFEGAVAHALGEVGPGRNQGLKQMMDQVNMSRLSHGVRAAGMMRRCLNEAMAASSSRIAFGDYIRNKPLLRRQLMKLMVPTEQVLSMVMFAAMQLGRAEAGDPAAEKLVRILTPLIKFRSARDNIDVATAPWRSAAATDTSKTGSTRASSAMPTSACFGKARPISTRSTSSPAPSPRSAHTRTSRPNCRIPSTTRLIFRANTAVSCREPSNAPSALPKKLQAPATNRSAGRPRTHSTMQPQRPCSPVKVQPSAPLEAMPAGLSSPAWWWTTA